MDPGSTRLVFADIGELDSKQVDMWETITQAEIEEAKAQLSRKREEALRRQGAEIGSLDAQLDDIESFERVVAAFFEEHMDEAAPSALAGSVPQGATMASLPEQSKLAPPEQSKLAPQGLPQNTPSLVLQIRQNILPKFNHRRSRGSSLAMSVAIPSDSSSEQRTAQVPAVIVPQR
jgi:hypothetical protein